MASVQSALPGRGDIIAGKYQVEGTLGQGGMGAVFEVTHRVTGKRFALKWLLPNLTAESDAVKRFIREAQVGGRVDHPNIVEVYDVGQEGDSFFMVMELLQGEALSARLASAHRLTPAQACTIMVPVCEAVSAAHSAGVIHRDLKPDNIFVCRDLKGAESPKVLDFGISKMSNLAGEVSSSVTRAGTVMGTPHYMAPEQVRARPVDMRTDVYALGVILYELLSGQLPFPGDTYSDIVLRIMTEAPPPLGQVAPSTPPALVGIVQKAMAREPEARFADVAALGRALEPFASATSTAAQTSAPSLSSSAPRTRTPLSTESDRLRTGDFQRSNKGLVVGVAAAVIAVVGAGLAVAYLSRQQAPTPAAATKPPATPPTTAPVTPPTSAEPAPANNAAPGELPIPRTVRVEPDPAAAPRAWEPPPGSQEAARPLHPPAAAEPEVAVAPPPSAKSAGKASKHRHGHGGNADDSSPPAPPKVDQPQAAPKAASSRTPLRTPGLAVEDF